MELLTLSWPIVALVFGWLANQRIKQWAELKKPLNEKQFQELNEKILKLQKEVSSLSIQNGMRNPF